MIYYNTAVLLSWLIVSGSLCIFANERGMYEYLPGYLIYTAFGGVVPALVCAWALRIIEKLYGTKSSSNWMLRGVYLGIGYVLMSNFALKYLIGSVSIDSVKGFLLVFIFGAGQLLEIGPAGLAIVILNGITSGAALHCLDRLNKSP